MSTESRSRRDQAEPKRRRRYEAPAIRKEQEFERVAVGCNFFEGPPFGSCTTAGSS